MFTLRKIKAQDHPILRQLAEKCPPLDIHTQYTYWVNAMYYGECCFLLLSDDEPIGYIMSLDTPDAVFIWQIGIIEEYRGRKLSKKLIQACADYAEKVGKNLQVTIAEDNKASYGAFNSFCKKTGMKFEKIDEINVIDLNDESFHEDEIRYMIYR